MTQTKPFAFVLMPFTSAFDDIYKLGIKAAAKELGVIAERVDEQSFSETILERIYRQIDHADIIIADMTGKNPNVFYEVGYAHAKNKPVVLLTQHAEDIPFDLKHHRHLIYDGSIATLREQLSSELAWQLIELKKNKTIPISISFKIVSNMLVDNEWSKTGNFDLLIDLQNSTDARSPEIEAMYIHSGSKWCLSVAGEVCPSISSNIEPYKLKHFVKTPVPRLSPGAWTQLKVNASKVFWQRFTGEEAKVDYSVQGSVLFEVVTTEGIFKESFNIDITLDEVPF